MTIQLLPPTSLSISYLPPISLSTSLFISYLPPFLPPTSLLSPTSLFIFYLPLTYLLSPFLHPTSFSTSYLSFYLLPPILYLPFTSYLTTSYLSFYLLPPFLPPTSLATSYFSPISNFPFYLLFLPHTVLKVSDITDLLHHRHLQHVYIACVKMSHHQLPTGNI